MPDLYLLQQYSIELIATGLLLSFVYRTSWAMATGEVKKVLIEFSEDTYEVSFLSQPEASDLLSLKRAAASAIGSISPEELVLRVESDEWGGRLVNVGEKDTIKDRTILKASIQKAQVIKKTLHH